MRFPHLTNADVSAHYIAQAKQAARLFTPLPSRLVRKRCLDRKHQSFAAWAITACLFEHHFTTLSPFAKIQDHLNKDLRPQLAEAVNQTTTLLAFLDRVLGYPPTMKLSMFPTPAIGVLVGHTLEQIHAHFSHLVSLAPPRPFGDLISDPDNALEYMIKATCYEIYAEIFDRQLEQDLTITNFTHLAWAAAKDQANKIPAAKVHSTSYA